MIWDDTNVKEEARASAAANKKKERIMILYT
jgi:hypothetical protein